MCKNNRFRYKNTYRTSNYHGGVLTTHAINTFTHSFCQYSYILNDTKTPINDKYDKHIC